MTVGIETLAFYTSRYVLPLATLAQARGIDPDKFHQGLGQYAMSVPPPGEDVVTLAANAAAKALTNINKADIAMLLFATESGIDHSKAAGIYVHDLLALPENCRVVELKQACYSATAGLQLALPYLQLHPDKKILLIAADIARYGLGTTGESSQGAGAIAMVLSANPRIIAFDAEFAVATQHAMDFWRPNYLHEALVEGKYSSKLYLTMLEKTYLQYQQQSQRTYHDLAYICYHAPVPRLVEKAQLHLQKLNQVQEEAKARVAAALTYSRQMGNSYTASLYIGLASLLDNTDENIANKRIGFYSYGSGCVAEFFSGRIMPQYREALFTTYHQQLLASRQTVSYQQYAEFFTYHYNETGDSQTMPEHDTGAYRLAKLANHQRIYEAVKVVPHQVSVTKPTLNTLSNAFKIVAPGKLILSGEHAIVHGQPALAMAINRYVTVTISKTDDNEIDFDFSNLAHRSVLSHAALSALKARIKQKYHRFIAGDFSIRRVLTKPFELAQYAFGLLSETLNTNLPHGMKIKVESELPMGCGLGSSAATIVSVMYALTTYLNMPLSREVFYKLALDVENMQHGKSSGFDLQLVMQGGCKLFSQQTLMERPIPTIPLYLINTGTPDSTTGQCVESVAPYFKRASLANAFGEVTHTLDNALQQQNLVSIKEAIAENQRLLTYIGVVPQRVQQFINKVEQHGDAAKLCGAGSIAGDKAGAVLVVTEDLERLRALANAYHYQWLPISGEMQGVHAA